MKKILSYAMFGILSMMFLAGSAQADILASAVRETFATNPSTTVANIALNDAGSTSVAFTTASAQTVAVLFNADCSVDTAGETLYIVIYVDGTAASGTSVNVARLCGDTQLEGHSRHVFASVAAGNHTVTVSAYTTAGTAKIRRSVLLVMN